MNEHVTARARSWLVLAFGDERQYAGNDGYDDVLTLQYLYDTSVQNHRQVAQGDILAICGRQRLEGFARIQEITAEQATKDRLRCPSCRTLELPRFGGQI